MHEYWEIFLIGLFGSAHCIGMCGGFVAMYSLGNPASRAAVPHHILYNLGRITTYAFLGGILGYIGSAAFWLGGLRGVPGAVLLLAGAVMVLMGLNIAGVPGKRRAFERNAITGMPVFRTSFQRILALKSQWGTGLLGLLLGFLPCGLLYPVLIHAAASGGPVTGALTMAVFGAGTAPAMFVFGLLVTRITPRLRLILYRAAAVLIILLGLRAFLRGMAFNGWIAPSRFW